MMTENELNILEKLSKLSFTREERNQLTKQLEDILLFADQMKEGQGIPQYISEHPDTLREDEVVPSFPGDALLQNAPQKEKGFFRLPRRGEG